jgi:hypothetical protein
MTRPTRRFHRLSAVLFAVIVLEGASHPAAQSIPPSTCALQTTERIVAVGDVHGAYDKFTGILRAAGIIDGRERWTGGRAVLVQTGDVLDRGADSRKALDLLRRLERDATRAGGRVHALLGNHEVMRMIGDWRYVSEGEYAAFRTADSADLRERAYQAVLADAAKRAPAESPPRDDAAFREQFMKEVPLGFLEMRAAFSAAGEYGRWLRGHDVVVKINDILFVHGGLTLAAASMGCDGLNETVRREVAGNPTPEAVPSMLAASEMGPLWYRGLAEQPEPALAGEVTAMLAKLGARAIVIGHTVTRDGRISPRFDGRVVQIDTGMLDGTFFPGGAPSALEIRGSTLAAIYSDHRENLQVPALATNAAR